MNKIRKIITVILFTFLFISPCYCGLQSMAKTKNSDVRNEYKEILNDIYNNPENYFSTDGDEDPLNSIRFSVGDIDSDGIDELMVYYDGSCMANMKATVFLWNEKTKEVVNGGNCFPIPEYYSTGYIKDLDSHNQGYGSMWPYCLIQISGGEFKALYSVDSIEESICNERNGEFPYDEDSDGDGIVYTLYDYLNDEMLYLTKEEFTAFEEKYIPASAKITFEVYDLTTENIEKITDIEDSDIEDLPEITEKTDSSAEVLTEETDISDTSDDDSDSDSDKADSKDENSEDDDEKDSSEDASLIEKVTDAISENKTFVIIAAVWTALLLILIIVLVVIIKKRRKTK